MNFHRPLVLCAGLILLWQLLVSLTGVPPYILPGPLPVAQAAVTHHQMLFIVAAQNGAGIREQFQISGTTVLFYITAQVLSIKFSDILIQKMFFKNFWSE